MAATAPQPLEIPADRRHGVERFAALVREIVGSRALALTLFGPALAGRERHPFDSALLLESDDLPLLRELGRKGSALARDLIAPPLILTREALARSRDTFPLELLEIAQCHVPLLGDDPYAGLEFAREHVRLECERELKSLAIGMRQRVLRAAGDGASLRPAELADGVVRVLRGMLQLKSAPPQRHGPEVIAAAQEALGRSLAPVRDAWTGSAGWDAYAALYAEVQALGTLVDGW